MVAQVSTLTITAQRGLRHWVLQCVEHPGAISEVARLDQAEVAMREAIAFVAEIPGDSFELEVIPVVPESVAEHLAMADRLRQEASRANSAAALEVRTAARELQSAGLSMRDVGTVLGVSHQRVHQLISS